MNCGVYKITSPLNKVYVGESKQIDIRFKNYKLLRCKNQKKIYASFLKYGVENHVFEILENCEIHLLKEKERYWQDFYNVLGDNGLNLKLTGIKDKKSSHSLETIEKIKKANIGRKHSDETKLKLKLFRTGSKRSEESINKQKAKMSGRIRPKEFGEKMSKILKGRLFSEEHKRKISIKAKNKFVSDETKLRMSLGSMGFKNGRSIKVINILTNKIYVSINEAAITEGFNPEHLRQMLNPKNRLKNKSNLVYYRDYKENI